MKREDLDILLGSNKPQQQGQEKKNQKLIEREKEKLKEKTNIEGL